MAVGSVLWLSGCVSVNSVSCVAVGLSGCVSVNSVSLVAVRLCFSELSVLLCLLRQPSQISAFRSRYLVLSLPYTYTYTENSLFSILWEFHMMCFGPISPIPPLTSSRFNPALPTLCLVFEYNPPSLIFPVKIFLDLGPSSGVWPAY